MSSTEMKIFAGGELLVTRTGEAIIDEVIPKSRGLLVHPDRYVSVRFDAHECGPPPCGGGVDDAPDFLGWELFMTPVHRHHHVRQPLL